MIKIYNFHHGQHNSCVNIDQYYNVTIAFFVTEFKPLRK
jgi:hypothetical protein